MFLARDKHLDLGQRQTALLRLEHYKRICSAKRSKQRTLLKALYSDAGVELENKPFVKHKLQSFSIWEKSTKSRSRCWQSGKSRQVKRNILLSRMHFKDAMSEGVLTGIRLQRS